MTRGTRKKFKSRPTREFSRRIRAFSSSPPSPEHGLLIGGEVGGTRKERKGHRTYSVLSYKWLFSEGTGEGRGERPAGGSRGQSHQDTGYSDRSVKR